MRMLTAMNTRMLRATTTWPGRRVKSGDYKGMRVNRQ